MRPEYDQARVRARIELVKRHPEEFLHLILRERILAKSVKARYVDSEAELLEALTRPEPFYAEAR